MPKYKLEHGKQIIDLPTIKTTIEKTEEKMGKAHELGEKFKSDSLKIKERREYIEKKDYPADVKSRLLAELDEAQSKLEVQYNRDVEAVQKQGEQEYNEQLENLQEGAEALDEEAEDLRDVDMEASDTDLSEAAAVAEGQSKEYSDLREEKQRLLNEQIEKNAQQRKVIQWSSGRRR